MVKGFLNVRQSSHHPILVWVLELWKLPSEYVPSFTMVWSSYGLSGYKNWTVSEPLVVLCVHLCTLQVM